MMTYAAILEATERDIAERVDIILAPKPSAPYRIRIDPHVATIIDRQIQNDERKRRPRR